MAFPTPSTAPREQGVSLLFTPLSKAADGQKGATPVDFRSFSGLGRTPASAGRGFGGAGTAGPTPPSRRRSLTPASSRQMDTPPPPPMDSLLDSPGGLGAGAAPWGQGPDGGEWRWGPLVAVAVCMQPCCPGSTLLMAQSVLTDIFGLGQQQRESSSAAAGDQPTPPNRPQLPAPLELNVPPPRHPTGPQWRTCRSAPRHMPPPALLPLLRQQGGTWHVQLTRWSSTR